MKAMRWIPVLGLVMVLGSCEKEDPGFVQGYVEGEFVHVASPAAGQLINLAVARGDGVKEGDLLFEIDPTPLESVRDEALHQVAGADATLKDLRAGQRPEEIAALEAQMNQARAALAYSRNQAERLVEARRSAAAAVADVDLANSRVTQDEQRVSQLQANLDVAKLGSRDGQIQATLEELRVRQVALANAQWQLEQSSQGAPQDAVVNDIVYRIGEWVPAGKPVVVLLPASNIKVRAFVPEAIVGRIHVGDPAEVRVDGGDHSTNGRVRFISPRAEYTPPVIYSQKMRAKFVFMVELTFEPAVASSLHPGQPVDVRFKLP